MAKKESKQKKINVRVDFTPMVDMLMLLITFFMLCTTLSKPQTMELTMPSNDDNTTEEQKNEAKASEAVTLYVAANNKLYYGEGIPNYSDPTWLKETTWGEKGTQIGNQADPFVFTRVRMHNGIFATEPSHGYNGGSYEWFLLHDGKEPGRPFNHPTDVSVDSKGNLFVCDGYGNLAVHKFDKDGNYVTTWGGKGVWDPYTDTPGKFLVPHCLAIDPNDNVWVCDREKDAVHVFNPDGEVVFYISNDMGQPSGVDTDGEYMYVVGRGGYLTIFDFDFNIVGELGFFNGNLRGHSVAADSKGNLYLFPCHANEEHQFIALKRIRD